MLLNIFFFSINTRGYPWILKNYVGIRITDIRHRYGYETNIYSTNRVRENYYPYYTAILKSLLIRKKGELYKFKSKY